MHHSSTWWRDGDIIVNLDECETIKRVAATVEFNLPTPYIKTLADAAAAITYHEGVMIFINENRVINL